MHCNPNHFNFNFPRSTWSPPPTNSVESILDSVVANALYCLNYIYSKISPFKYVCFIFYWTLNIIQSIVLNHFYPKLATK